MTLSVIGAGLGRTGTLSLKLALEQLGLGPCYHMAEVFKLPRAPAQWIAAAEGHPDWEATFEGYRSTVDWPSAEFYKELAEAYPDARV
ncbi:MAG TPA: sulfotransferase, partial [Caulobacteraceae bacterium]